jgi:hypothetical protein
MLKTTTHEEVMLIHAGLLVPGFKLSSPRRQPDQRIPSRNRWLPQINFANLIDGLNRNYYSGSNVVELRSDFQFGLAF